MCYGFEVLNFLKSGDVPVALEICPNNLRLLLLIARSDGAQQPHEEMTSLCGRDEYRQAN